MPPSSLPIGNWLKPIAQSLSNLFSSYQEPVISQQVDQSGLVVWHIYNPHTKTLIEFSSEREMLEWLDRNPIV